MSSKINACKPNHINMSQVLPTNNSAGISESHLFSQNYAIHKQPNFIGSEDNYIPNNENQFEQDQPADDLEAPSPEFLHRAARNLLRFLIHGAVLDNSKTYFFNRIFSCCKEFPEPQCPKTFALIQKGLTEQKNPEFLKAIRNELQYVLHNIHSYLKNEPEEFKNPKIKLVEENKATILINNILAAFPFLDPVENKEENCLHIPQKIDGSWQYVKYLFGKIDISPKSGLLAWVLQENDRIYCYTLTPDLTMEQTHKDEVNKSCAYLLFMGTTYPVGQGADLAELYNFYPGHSVGEGHNFTEVDDWICKIAAQGFAINISGHSMGGTVSMITAARHPDKIQQVHCLGPAGLTSETLNRYDKNLNSDPGKKPKIIVYAQKNDPVPFLGNGFFEGTIVTKIDVPGKKTSNYSPWIPSCWQKAFEAHLQYFAGHNGAVISDLTENIPYAVDNKASENDEKKEDCTEQSLPLLFNKEVDKFQNKTRMREFVNDIKSCLNLFLFPKKYLSMITSRLKATIITRWKEKILDNANVSKSVKYFNWAFYGLFQIANFITKVLLFIPLEILNVAYYLLISSAFIITSMYSILKIFIKSLISMCVPLYTKNDLLKKPS